MRIIEILKISAIYVTFVSVITLLSFLPIQKDLFYWKEVLFGYWGYGWDGMHYIKIATDGYHFPLQAFFPVYPILIKAVNMFAPLSIAYRINVLLLPIALYVIARISKLMGYSSSRQKLIIVGTLALPSAFFLQANYTETLYIMLAGLSLLALFNKQYWRSALLVGLLSGVKATGVLIAPIIAYSYWKNTKKTASTKIIKAFFLLSMSVFGVVLYFSYLSINSDSFLIFFRAQEEWNRNLFAATTGFFSNFINHPVQAIRDTPFALYRVVLETTFFFLIVALLKKSFKKMNRSLWLYSLLHFASFVLSGSLMSLHRLGLLLFPLIIFGYGTLLEKRKCYFVVISISLVIQVIGIYLFHHNVFVG